MKGPRATSTIGYSWSSIAKKFALIQVNLKTEYFPKTFRIRFAVDSRRRLPRKKQRVKIQIRARSGFRKYCNEDAQGMRWSARVLCEG
jgi:hypothetical protein